MERQAEQLALRQECAYGILQSTFRTKTGFGFFLCDRLGIQVSQVSYVAGKSSSPRSWKLVRSPCSRSFASGCLDNYLDLSELAPLFAFPNELVPWRCGSLCPLFNSTPLFGVCWIATTNLGRNRHGQLARTGMLHCCLLYFGSGLPHGIPFVPYKHQNH